MLIEAFAIWPNKGQAKLAIAGSNLTGVDTRCRLQVESGSGTHLMVPVDDL
jgi:hypothetical protein